MRKKIDLVIEVTDSETGFISKRHSDDYKEIEECINDYVDIFGVLPAKGILISYEDEEALVVGCVEFSSFNNCAFIYLETIKVGDYNINLN